MNWCDEFTVLELYIDNKLEKLKYNLVNIKIKVKNLINKWRLYYLSLHGCLTIVKSIVLAQYIYIGTIMDMLYEEDMKKLQTTLNQFVAYNEVGRGSRTTWTPVDIIYAPTNQGEFNMIKVKYFFHALKTAGYEDM